MTAPTQPLTCPPSGVLLVGGVPDDLPAVEAALSGPGGVVRACSGAGGLAPAGRARLHGGRAGSPDPGAGRPPVGPADPQPGAGAANALLLLLARNGADFPLAEAYALGTVDHLTRPIISEVLRTRSRAAPWPTWPARRTPGTSSAYAS